MWENISRSFKLECWINHSSKLIRYSFVSVSSIFLIFFFYTFVYKTAPTGSNKLHFLYGIVLQKPGLQTPFRNYVICAEDGSELLVINESSFQICATLYESMDAGQKNFIRQPSRDLNTIWYFGRVYRYLKRKSINKIIPEGASKFS